jgi:hypothetical protein
MTEVQRSGNHLSSEKPKTKADIAKPQLRYRTKAHPAKPFKRHRRHQRSVPFFYFPRVASVVLIGMVSGADRLDADLQPDASLNFIEYLQVDGIGDLERNRESVGDFIREAPRVLDTAHLDRDIVAVAEGA